MNARPLLSLLTVALLTLACGDEAGGETPGEAQAATTASQGAPAVAGEESEAGGPSDEAACDAVWEFYEIINPTDEFAERTLRAAAAKAETTEARQIIEQEARYWGDGVPTWDEGAIDFCIELM